jgi:quercetin dioxygenase-like cupin family protein
MLVNADFTQRAIVAPHQYQWVDSPQGGIERVMLDRLGGEDARATSIVRYAPDSCFPRHLHPQGEEILVLSGTFSEGDQHYPAGWYLRNPPGSSHQPSSAGGAIIFVKLQQMAPRDRQVVRVDTRDPRQWQTHADGDVCHLCANDVERVWLQRLPPGGMFRVEGGVELLMLNGEAHFEGHSYPRGTWMRFPAGDPAQFVAGTQGATLYVKQALLVRARAEAIHA